ncbi:uncharacterized protein LOC142618347 isoform X2 [Castanea sativa]|uniref:uncharacterized protein LOC142618347 isoform X2 n=1 Tax=Castanea sativa TaxID=21020 RepID=UPI003F654610
MSRGSRSSGGRGFSSGSGFGYGFRGRRARNSDTLDVKVNELEDLHRRSHEAEASGDQNPLGFVKLTGAAAEAAAKEGKPLGSRGEKQMTIDENMRTKQQDLARNSNYGLLDMHDLMFAII